MFVWIARSVVPMKILHARRSIDQRPRYLAVRKEQPTIGRLRAARESLRLSVWAPSSSPELDAALGDDSVPRLVFGEGADSSRGADDPVQITENQTFARQNTEDDCASASLDSTIPASGAVGETSQGATEEEKRMYEYEDSPSG